MKIKIFSKYIKNMSDKISISANMELDYVTKRDGTKEEMTFDKILRRIKILSDGLSINPQKVTQKVTTQIYPIFTHRRSMNYRRYDHYLRAS